MRALRRQPDSPGHQVGDQGGEVWAEHPVLSGCPRGGTGGKADCPAARPSTRAEAAILGRMTRPEGAFPPARETRFLRACDIHTTSSPPSPFLVIVASGISVLFPLVEVLTLKDKCAKSSRFVSRLKS